MAIIDTAIAVVVFVGLFAIVEYATYRVMERKHEKRGIYRLLFMAAWTTLAFVHMWVVAPLLNLPPTAVVGLGFGIIAIHIAGGLGVPVLKSIGVIGLFPFALVYELFVVLLLLAEGVALVASFVSIPQLSFLSTVVPNDPRVQAAIGLGIAASVVAVMYYDPKGENGYYYAAGHNLPGASVDYEKFRQIKEGEQPAHTDSTDSDDRKVDSPVSQDVNSGDRSRPNTSRALAKAPDDREFEYNWTRSDVRFDDIGGYYDVKEQLVDEVIEPLRAVTQGNNSYDRFGIKPSRGILLYGPPGTGKTMFARALAGELGVPFVELSPADITSKWINEGPQRVRQLFDEAESIGPCVIFLDEAEHLFGGRDVGTGGAHAEDKKITSELLVHLTKEDRDAIIIGATNRPEDVDPAILRPGRLATHVEIGLPSEESRQAIFQSKLRGVPNDLSGDDLAMLARHTAGLSGADIEELVNDVKRNAAKRDAQKISISDFPSVDELEALTDAKRPHRSGEPNTDSESQRDAPSRDRPDDDPGIGYQ